MTFRKHKFFEIRPCFRNFLALLENYRVNSQVKCSFEKLGFWNHLYFTATTAFFQNIFFGFRKVSFLTLDRFFFENSSQFDTRAGLSHFEPF